MKKFIIVGSIYLGSINLFAQNAEIIYNNALGSTVTIETENGLGSGFLLQIILLQRITM